MSLINPLILYGLGLAAIPVILHFLMRNKPRKLFFPALRLIRVRRKTNTRRMRLRHIWLMLLRMAVFALLVLALARPSLPAANYGLNLRESLTLLGIVSAAFASYWWVMRSWRRQRLPHHVLTYRRSLLRGGTGLGTLLLFLLLVVWPYQRRIAAETSAPLPEVAKNLPVAAVFLFDTSLSMEYRLESQTRLEVAKSIAGQQLSQLPSGSRIGVADTSTDTPILFQADLFGAQNRIDGLEIRPIAFPLNDRLKAAIRLQEDDRQRTLTSGPSPTGRRVKDEGADDDERQDRYLREIYLFSDLSQSAWRTAGSRLLREELSRRPWIQLYIIDVGVEQPTDAAVSSLRLSNQTVSTGGELIVEATVDAVGTNDAERTVELYVQNDKGELVKQGQSTVQLGKGSGAAVTFSVQGLSGPVSQGEVRLASSDPLSNDDVRYFTVAVRRPPQILVVADVPREAVYWTEALAPTELRRQGKARYRVTSLPAEKLAGADLGQYEVVCLVHVRRLSAAAWDLLGRYVEAGGGLAVFLGMPNSRVNPVSVGYNSEVPQSFLPARLLADLKFTPPEYLDLRDLSHPLLHKFESLGGVGELTSVEVRRYWRVEPVAGASVVARYTDSRQSPALVERVHGDGRTVMLTTGVDLDGWSDLPRVWSFVALADQMMQYLGRRTDHVYNYTAGEEVRLPLDPQQSLRRYFLLKPGLEKWPGEVPVGAEVLTIPEADQVGQYEVTSAEEEGSFRSGFSVNPTREEHDLTRLDNNDLDALLGEKRYSITRSLEELTRGVAYGRIGQEMYPFVLIFLMIAFCAEHVVANRFYEADQSTRSE